MEGVSILVTAYKSKKYIKECLDSINNQVWFKENDNYEILLGIDGCLDTLKYIKNIMHSYNNLRVFMMDSNKGTYITTNTLISISKYDYLMRFDSDDIMCPTMISKSFNRIEKFDLLRYNFRNFRKDINNKDNKNRTSCGVIFFRREILDKLGGFYGVKCAADSDFLNRTKILKYKIGIISEELFHRRLHNDSLSQSKETKKNSQIRRKAKQYFRKQLKENITFVKIKTNKYNEIK